MVRGQQTAQSLQTQSLRDMTAALLIAALVLMTGIGLMLRRCRKLERGLEDAVNDRTRELQDKNQHLTREIERREAAERSCRRSSQHYRALMETSSNPIAMVDAQGSIRQWNSASENLFGYTRREVLGQTLTDFIPAPYQDELAWRITKLSTSQLESDTMEVPIQDYGGTPYTILWNINRLEDGESPDDPQLLFIGQDISEIRATQDKLHFLAHYDMLTGTANRRLFEDRCRQAMESAQRYGASCALITLDIDHFKRVNDTLGHDAGDELLKQMAERLRQSVRREDTIARLGGDEFAVLLNRVNGIEGCDRVARSLLQALTQPVRIQGGELIITSSLGITLTPDDGCDYETLLKNADMAMYRAKKEGRNTIQFFNESMNREIQRQMQLEQELAQAIEQGALELFYQPMVDLNSGALQGVEALLRWRHGQHGILEPAEFLDVAEQTGQLLRIGEWVCHNACLQARAIQTMSQQPTPVSINLSSRQYHHPMLADRLSAILADTAIAPHLLCLEVDEEILADRPQDAITILKTLKRLGVTLVLDRFGHGLSSVRFLRDMPFDQVKIDRSLLTEVPRDRAASAVVRTLVELSHEMGLTVVANGVENDEQIQFLRSIRCHLVQGYRLCSPVPDRQLGELFERTRSGKPFQTGLQFDLLTPTQQES